MKNIVDYANVLKGYNKIEDLPEDVLKEAKRLGFSDFQIARYVESPEGNMEKENIRVRNLRKENGHSPYRETYQHDRFRTSGIDQLSIYDLRRYAARHHLLPE